MKNQRKKDIMREVLISVGSLLFNGKWLITMSNDTQTCTVECSHENWCSPLYGRRLNEQEIKEIIGFLQKALEEKGSDGQSNLE
jgi:hypothetical protein